MGLRDDDPRIYEDRDLLDWAREYPTPPGDYDHAASEEDKAAHEYAVRKWRERRPNTSSGYDDRGR